MSDSPPPLNVIPAQARVHTPRMRCQRRRQDRARPSSLCSPPRAFTPIRLAHVLIGGTMVELLSFVAYLVWLYEIVVIASVILSWLIGFNVVNAYNPFVRSLWQGLNAVTEPLLRPIRRALP